jgi:serine/threonine protein kinase
VIGMGDSGEDRAGARLGKYALTRLLGAGGMGVVYEAEDALLQRKVAIKLLSSLSFRADAARFLREAQRAACLNHPNAVAIYEVDPRKDGPFLVMELVEGPSAEDRLRAGALPWPEATRIVAGVCRALVAAHGLGLIHQDVKPANVLCAPNGVAKLSDFGLARPTGASTTPSARHGPTAGTPYYMSPEACRGEQLDDRADLYSLGATYYALLVGKPPFTGSSPLEVMFAHCSQPVPDPRAVVPTIPENCASVVRRALAKYPAQRYRNASAMLADLEALLPEARTTSSVPAPATRRCWRWHWVAYGAVAALLLVALLVWLLTTGERAILPWNVTRFAPAERNGGAP